MPWRREPRHVTDLGDDDGGDGAPDPVDRLHRLIATMVTQMAVDVALEHDDLAVVDLDQVTNDSTRIV